jgi:hypothetical protein
MKIFSYRTILQSLDYGSYKFVTLEQNFVNMMIQCRTKEGCSVDNTKSSNLELS